MYQAHFGLKQPLFEGGIAHDAAVFLAPKHEVIIANSKVALTTLDSVVVLTGTAGVGKTTLISAALRTTSTRLALGWITGAPLNAAELLELLLVEFGFHAHRVGRVERMQMWRQFLNEMSATESRVFVIVERADDLSHEVLRALDSLTAADPNGCPGANLVLLGQPGLIEHLKAPLLESLRQRIRLRERLEPLTADELRAYLAHQATRAGGSFDNLFAPKTVDTLHALSGGIPRIANNLCETALTLAATGNESLLTPELLTRIAVAMFGMEAPAAANTTAAPPAQKTAPSAPLVSATFATPVSTTFAPTAALVYAPLPVPAASAAFDAAQPAASAPAAAPPPAAAHAPAAAAAPAATPTAPLPAAAVVVPALQPKTASAASSRTDAFTSTRTEIDITSEAGPLLQRTTRASAAPPPANPPPVVPSRAGSRAPKAAEPMQEIDSFADTLTDSPDVQMPDYPVLTDEVTPPAPVERPRARAEMAYSRPTAPQPAARPPAASARPPFLPVIPPADPHTAATKPAPPAAKPPAFAAAPKVREESGEDQIHPTQTVRALAAAKSIDDISNSMAETLFGEADLDSLSAALASSWPEIKDSSAEPSTLPKDEPKKDSPAESDDPFDFFGLGPDAPLELIDDSTPDDNGRKAVNNR